MTLEEAVAKYEKAKLQVRQTWLKVDWLALDAAVRDVVLAAVAKCAPTPGDLMAGYSVVVEIDRLLGKGEGE